MRKWNWWRNLKSLWWLNQPKTLNCVKFFNLQLPCPWRWLPNSAQWLKATSYASAKKCQKPVRLHNSAWWKMKWWNRATKCSHAKSKHRSTKSQSRLPQRQRRLLVPPLTRSSQPSTRKASGRNHAPSKCWTPSRQVLTASPLTRLPKSIWWSRNSPQMVKWPRPEEMS